MSKGNMLLGHARGKVGSLVFSRSNGEQIVRSRAEVVKNPRTDAQTLQRVVLNTVAQAYSRMSVITDHSFEGIPSGQKTMSEFMKRNMQMLRAHITQDVNEGYDLGSIWAFTPVSTNIYAPNAYIVSKGTLPEVSAVIASTTTASVENISANTYAGVIESLGLQRGDQLTFIGTSTAGQNTTFNYVRVILDPRNADGTEADLSSAFIANGAINLPSPRNEGELASIAFADNKITFSFSRYTLTGVAVIVSRKKSDGTWARSNATMAYDDANASTFGYSMQQCIDMVNEGGVSLLSDVYLNNAGSARLAPASGGTNNGGGDTGGGDTDGGDDDGPGDGGE